MEDILREIDAALERLGLSARAASIRAHGAPEMIRDMRRGHVPSVERLRSLCEVLDLELYVGQRRLRWDKGADVPDVPLRILEQTTQELVQLTADVGGNPVSDDLLSLLIAKRAAKLSPAESENPQVESLLSGMVPSFPVTAIDSTESRHLKPLREVQIGQGWLDILTLPMHGLELASCEVAEIRDEHMEPTLPNGCTVLVDQGSTDWQPSRIMAVRIDNDVIARRAAFGDDGRRLMASDHPDWPVVPLPASAEVIGEVRWASFWLNRTLSAGEQAEDTPAFTPSHDRGNLAG